MLLTSWPDKVSDMKPNPFVVPLLVAGGIVSLLGLAFTVLGLVNTSPVPVLDDVAPLLLSLGIPLLAAGLVVAGIDWRLTHGR